MQQELFISDVIQLKSRLHDLRQWLPFAESTSQAYEELKKRVSQFDDCHSVIGVTVRGRVELVLDYSLKENKLNLHLVLVSNRKFSWQQILKEIDKTAKSHRASVIEFSVLGSFLDSFQLQKLIEQGYGYEKKANRFDIEKELTYHTGLVLGGGGAKGAYQIGVWKALRECHVSFDIVTGTSVGALNGGLIIQDDLPAAEKMWETIDTQDILSVPIEAKEETDFTLQQLVSFIQTFTLSAIKNVGTDTTPLQQLIIKLMDEDRIFATDKQFFIVTTQAPKMIETIVSMADMTKETFPKWLLASSSFFPAMSACQIDERYYVDGGYRNNIPIDVALKAGATELIEVNVKGPGLIKLIKVPQEIPVTKIESHWGLGNVLLFDNHRSGWNLRLGYLEGLKAFNRLSGKNYTFYKKSYKRENFELSRAFIRYAKEQSNHLFVNPWTTHDLVEQLIKRQYNPSVLFGDLIENTARTMMVDPTTIYSFDTLSQTIIKATREVNAVAASPMLLTFKEWLVKYIEQIDYLSPQQKLVGMRQLLFNKTPLTRLVTDKDVSKQFDLILQSLFLEFLSIRFDGNECE
ncbi:patatin-like phospholipase family protein [Vagococcus vulneris]|uniref:PNPLA domain-containing protein n=1 Tax=Vagococcus vulneris TaxID=1977869 RepID=A0A429ZXN6_9ENTE|nr:patatin-like phospholipase family protein [Vagococcus vulneris]RST98575.1 hypothetical protein CBF37_07310 [Vagococcus vulneris]